MLAVYVATVFLSAALLFTIQPMIAKMILPHLGGSPSVWNSCMAFFQVALLAGYTYAHLLTRRVRPIAQVATHAAVLLLALPFLPIGLQEGSVPDEIRSPALWTLRSLAVSVGLPSFVLAATAPMLQRWFSMTRSRLAADPYWLYAASNSGSLLALISYPVVIEPRIRLAGQSTVWALGYLLLASLTVIAGTLWVRIAPPARPAPSAVPSETPAGISTARRCRWVGLALVPSSAMLATTQRLSTDIAAVPLLWVLPLALYLLTYILAFLRRSVVRVSWSGYALAVLVLGTTYTQWIGLRHSAAVMIALNLLIVFAIGLLCHRRLAEDRPPPEHLTEFYLLLALGGALGGLFNALAAPVLFNSILEYPIVLVLACMLRPDSRVGAGGVLRRLLIDVSLAAGLGASLAGLERLSRLPPLDAPLIALTLRVGVPVSLCLLMIRRPVRFALGLAVLMIAGGLEQTRDVEVLHAVRTFFGVHRVLKVDPAPYVVTDDSGQISLLRRFSFHSLVHGTTTHGMQFTDPELRGVPTTYYHRTGPIGQVMEALEHDPRLDDVAVIGLGAGTLAAYGRPGQRLTYYEIDPAVVRIAGDPRFFTFLSQAACRTQIVVGDGRLEIARADEGRYGLVVVDAFLSDAIPVHLLTREAVETYLRKMQPGGILSLHVTNYYLDLEPVASAIARALNLSGLIQEDREISETAFTEGKERSVWVLLARNETDLQPFAADPRWRRLRESGVTGSRSLWRDDFSSVFSVLKF